MKLIKLAYSAIVYVFFLGVFNYFIIFLAGDALAECFTIFASLKSVDSGPVWFSIPGIPAALSNLIILLVFSLQHSIMARLGFKRLLTRLLPQSAERSTYVLSTCLILLWLYLAWQPMPAMIWQVEGGFVHVIAIVFLMGAGLVLWATFMISHWELFGLAQAWNAFRGVQPEEKGLTQPAMYKYTRHPLYLGLFVVLWATPQMTLGHLVMAVVWSVYIFIGISFEERDLIRQFGRDYQEYMQRVPKLLPLGRKAGWNKTGTEIKT